MIASSASPASNSQGAVTKTDVLIVGAGFSGIGTAIKLHQAGLDSFIVIDKDDEIGGTWYQNHYPGCACDIPSHLYSFSFDCNPEWTRMYSGQPEIEEYLKGCVDRHGIRRFIRLKARLAEARWDDAAGRWRAMLGDGSIIEARVLVSGMGALHVPHYPEIPGIERFAGPAFHSARWRHDVELEGKRIAVIGTGASAIQFVPHIAPLASKLMLFQRTPPWILPRLDHPIAERWKQRFRRSPALMKAFRYLIFWQHEIRVIGFLGNRTMRKIGERMAKRHLESQVADPKLREILTPNYDIGCKRVLASNDFYPAITGPNAEIVTEPIQEVREHSIVTAGGVERPVDVLIYGTGFHVSTPLVGTCIFGRDGVEIHDAWKQRVSAHLGITVRGFPNLFILLGPNTGLGHNSVVLMIEAQIRYFMECMQLMRRRGSDVMEVTAEAQNAFVDEVRRRLAPTVWQSGGCRSWYQDASGENPTIWPGSVVSYMRRTSKVRSGDFSFR